VKKLENKEKTAQNTDIHLFYQDENDPGYSSSCYMTKDKRLGIQVGGYVTEMTLKQWKALEKERDKLKEKYKDLLETKTQVHMRAMRLNQELQILKEKVRGLPNYLNGNAQIDKLKKLIK